MYISFFFVNKGQIGCLDIKEHSHLYLVKKYTSIVKKYSVLNEFHY